MRERTDLLSPSSADEHHVYIMGNGVVTVSEVCDGKTRVRECTFTRARVLRRIVHNRHLYFFLSTFFCMCVRLRHGTSAWS